MFDLRRPYKTLKSFNKAHRDELIDVMICHDFIKIQTITD